MLSKWVEAFPLQVTDGFNPTSTLMNEVICCYGVPTQPHSDQGSNLNAEVDQKLCQLFRIQCHQNYTLQPTGKWVIGTF